MRRFEYKVVSFEVKLGFDYEKKKVALEAQWNELGDQGWQYCCDGNGCVIFMREKDQEDMG